MVSSIPNFSVLLKKLKINSVCMVNVILKSVKSDVKNSKFCYFRRNKAAIYSADYHRLYEQLSFVLQTPRVSPRQTKTGKGRTDNGGGVFYRISPLKIRISNGMFAYRICRLLIKSCKKKHREEKQKLMRDPIMQTKKSLGGCRCN